MSRLATMLAVGRDSLNSLLGWARTLQVVKGKL